MTDTKHHETALRTLIQQWVDATCKGDLDAVMALYTPDVVAFDAIGALQHKGVDAYRQHWEMCLSFMPPGGEMIMEPHEVTVSVGGDIAFAHYVSRCGCIDDKGEQQIGWLRATVCCRNMPEGWRIVHEHYSSPFDPQTMKIAEDLAP
ncbi:YybH family protein [Marinimicrobium alkaliphilum]|uniref:YybH family protein n=1 Tax=Marinimicrobium alkaliphilum TaxID=2202654 RepID=UPI000DB98943|nr:SgcJ/EcaC family oxidoreductase [Marinimicrobium alkaliphilum]